MAAKDDAWNTYENRVVMALMQRIIA